jgi:hypothetical protein
VEFLFGLARLVAVYLTRRHDIAESDVFESAGHPDEQDDRRTVVVDRALRLSRSNGVTGTDLADDHIPGSLSLETTMLVLSAKLIDLGSHVEEVFLDSRILHRQSCQNHNAWHVYFLPSDYRSSGAYARGRRIRSQV